MGLVAIAGAISVMTFPGQTAGLAAFTDPLIQDLGVSRTGISVSYLIGTLLGALAQPVIGRTLDRWGARRVTVVIAIGFVFVLLGLSFVSGPVGLTLGFIGVRMAGQGALSLAATTAVARTIHHRRGLALGVAGAVGSAGISLAPIGLERLISMVGFADTWRWEALAVAVIVIPLALLLPGLAPPAKSASLSTGSTVTVEGWTLPEAIRTGMFWVIAASLAASSMLSTGLAFHQIAILGEQGLSALEAAANFLPQTVTGLLATLLTGALVDRLSPRLFVKFSMATLAAALLMLPFVSPGWSAIAYGLVLGAAGGSLRGMEVASYVRYYGTAHIGTIRGMAVSISLAASALGPLAFAVGFNVTEGFTVPAMILAIIPCAVAVLAGFVRAPRRRQAPATL